MLRNGLILCVKSCDVFFFVAELLLFFSLLFSPLFFSLFYVNGELHSVLHRVELKYKFYSKNILRQDGEDVTFQVRAR